MDYNVQTQWVVFFFAGREAYRGLAIDGAARVWVFFCMAGDALEPGLVRGQVDIQPAVVYINQYFCLT